MSREPYTENHRYRLIQYSEGDDPSSERISIEVHENSLTDKNLEEAAKRCAEYHFHVHRDYSQEKWSEGISLTLWRDGEKLDSFTMYLEMVPEFTASRDYEKD